MNSYTTLNAHSLKKGDTIILTATELHLYRHPQRLGDEVELFMEFLGPGHRHSQKFPINTPVPVLVGGNGLGGSR